MIQVQLFLLLLLGIEILHLAHLLWRVCQLLQRHWIQRLRWRKFSRLPGDLLLNRQQLRRLGLLLQRLIR